MSTNIELGPQPQTIEGRGTPRMIARVFSRFGLAVSLGISGAGFLTEAETISNPSPVASEISVEVQGIYDFDNSKIVENAVSEDGQTFALGWGQPGECMVAAQRWANAANGGKNLWDHRTNGVISIYTDSGGKEIGLDKLEPGDILQRASMGDDFDTNWTSVHTLVFRGYNSDGTMKIVDSNRMLDGKVRVTDSYVPTAKKGWGWRAFRFGKVGKGSSGGGGNSSPGSAPKPASNQEVPYAAIADGTEFYTREGHYYTKVGGTAMWIKYGWNSGDSFNWGGQPVGPVSVDETHDHELGFGGSGAHPPRDGTVVFEQNRLQQWDFVQGHAYPITGAELDDLSARNKALMIPRGKLSSVAYGNIDIGNGTLYRYAGTPQVNQYIEIPGDIGKSFHVNGATVLDCLRITQGREVQVFPQSTRDYLGGWYGIGETSTPAECQFPSGMVLFGPGGREQWRVDGSNKNGYVRHYFKSALDVYLHTSGNPDYRTFSSANTLNSIPEGPRMETPNGIFFENKANGDVFKVDNGIFRKVPWPDMLKCLGSPSVVPVPGNIVGALPQGPMMSCDYDNRVIVGPDGHAFYIKDGQRHSVPNPAVRDCISVRRGAGAPINDVSYSAINSYPASDNAYCNYEDESGLNFVQENGDPTVWLIVAGGIKRHVGANCVVDPYTTAHKKFHIFSVPTGETAGHTQGPDFFGNPQICGQLPG